MSFTPLANTRARCDGRRTTEMDENKVPGAALEPGRELETHDPPLEALWVARHEEALQRGEAFYLDPLTGLWVQTSATLAKNGQCCGRGCRHCPYDQAEQKRAGRRVLRPA